MNIDAHISVFRQMIVGIDTKIPLADGRLVTSVNLDNAATTPPLKQSLDALVEFAPWYSSIHRGTGYKSVRSTDAFEQARHVLAEFVHADPSLDSVILKSNTTDAINTVATVLQRLCPHCTILVTEMEHHSNLLPWRQHFPVEVVKTDSSGQLVIEELEHKLKSQHGRIKLVAVSGASNVTGIVNPIHEIAQLCHENGAYLLVDGAQLVPHCEVNMLPHSDDRHIDFLAFSGHKLYAPFGTGILIGPKAFFNAAEPMDSGGGTVKVVTTKKIIWADTPERHEAGTPNLLGAISLAAAVSTISSIGIQQIETCEQELDACLIRGMTALKQLHVYSDHPKLGSKHTKRIGITAFNIEGISHYTVARILSDEFGISVRSGCFCAHPYLQKLLHLSDHDRKKLIKHPDSFKPGAVRISLGMYNSLEEIDYALTCLKSISENTTYFQNKFDQIEYQRN